MGEGSHLLRRVTVWKERLRDELGCLPPCHVVGGLEAWCARRAWRAVLVPAHYSVHVYPLDGLPKGVGRRHVCKGLLVRRDWVLVVGGLGDEVGRLSPGHVV